MKLIRKLQEELCHKENDIKEANFKIVSYKKTNSDLGAKVVAEKNAGIDANLESAATVTPTRTVLEAPGNNAFDTAGIDANLESAATVTPTRTVLEAPGNNAFDTAGIDANLESAATVTD